MRTKSWKKIADDVCRKKLNLDFYSALKKYRILTINVNNFDIIMGMFLKSNVQEITTLYINNKVVTKEEFEKTPNQKNQHTCNQANNSCDIQTIQKTQEEIQKGMKESYCVTKTNKNNIQEKTQSELEYYTSKKFNIFETVEFLSNYPDWKAKYEDKFYTLINKQLCWKYNDNNFGGVVYITTKSLNMMFELVPPEEKKEEWIDIEANNNEALLVNIINKFQLGNKIRMDNGIREWNYDEFERFMNGVDYNDLCYSKWQYLKK